ncbi:MAG: haloacid dehalogenase [Verrucomicrobiaceae bacterium]|nr:haloacid dehalogenase [Verrucomicrobiaceae bacterium]
MVSSEHNHQEAAQQDLIFLFDVDNTLLDNDSVLREWHAHIEQKIGPENAKRYWDIHNELRDSLGYVDYLGALQRFRLERLDAPAVLWLSTYLLNYPLSKHLFNDALAVLQHCRGFGETAILSDGDAVLQPHKIQSTGLLAAVEGRVLIYVHKERMLDEMQQHFPARHYVMVDDKPNILAAMKQVLGSRLTTVFPQQGHYALDPANVSAYPNADITVANIGDLLQYDKAAFLNAAQTQ